MANRTVGDAHTIHGKNPQSLIEKVIRTRIYESMFWKEECFALTCELLVDKAVDLKFVGGLYSGSNKATPFLCLLLKMLQIQPEKDIIIEFLRRNEFKYSRALAAFYLRLTGDATEIYKYLEPLYNDYSKLKYQEESGKFSIFHMDDFIDELLRSDRVCTIILPRIQKRDVLESGNYLGPRLSILDEDLQEMMLLAIEEEELENARKEEEELKRTRKEEEESKKNEDKRIKENKYRRSRSHDGSRDRRRSRSRSSSEEKSRRSPKREHRERRNRSKSKERKRRRRRSSTPKRDHRDREKERCRSRDRR